MKKNLLLLLLALLALASCEQKGYQPKNQVEETLLGVARDSLGYRGEITISDFALIDTFTHYKKDYEDSIRAVFPHSVDFVASYDSLEARKKRVDFLMDSIFDILHKETDYAKRDKKLKEEHSKLSDEYSAIHDNPLYIHRLMQRYQWMLASGQDPFVFISGRYTCLHEGEGHNIDFVLSADGKQVLMYRDVEKHLEKIQQQREINKLL